MNAEKMIGMLQWNIQGAREKKEELLDSIELYKPSIVALQETKL